MKRIALGIALLAWLSAACTATVRAQDKVTYLDQKTGKQDTAIGVIQSETPTGITIKVGTKSVLIPGLDVVEVDYKLPESVKGFQYKAPFGLEREGLKKKDARERMTALTDAQREFDKLATAMGDNPGAVRYLQYRSALIPVQIAKLDATKRDAAIDALKRYRAENSGGWEAVPSAKLLATLQEESGDINGAKQTYEELRILRDVPKEVVLESNIYISNLLLRAKKYADAEKTLTDAKALLPENDPLRSVIVVHLCEAQMKQGKTQDIEKQLLTAINGTPEANVRALGHNTLGDYYRAKKQDEEAFWQYLRVDVLYPADREEHARSLYWLSKLFDSVKKDKPKAQECLDKLKSMDFEGTEYAQRAATEK
jgi:predicted Zn-dependent protease